MGGGDADTNHDAGAVIPYIAVGAGWVEWERSHCLPGVYIEVSGPGHAYVDLAEALKMRMALDEAIEAVRGLLVGDHHLLCDCTVDQTVGVDGD
ncbi:hypothetical protein [Williamsia sterculiae]|nr:hypothetical protein [Williamsia sterculiae]